MGLRTLDKLHERLIASFLKWRYRPKTEMGLVRWAAHCFLGSGARRGSTADQVTALPGSCGMLICVENTYIRPNTMHGLCKTR